MWLQIRSYPPHPKPAHAEDVVVLRQEEYTRLVGLAKSSDASGTTMDFELVTPEPSTADTDVIVLDICDETDMGRDRC